MRRDDLIWRNLSLSAKTNCVNCGAPIDAAMDKCPYCKTSYFDMSAIDFESGKPIALKVRHGNMIITSLVLPYLDTVTKEYNTYDILGGCGGIIDLYCADCTITTNVRFESVRRPGSETLMEVIMDGK